LRKEIGMIPKKVLLLGTPPDAHLEAIRVQLNSLGIENILVNTSDLIKNGLTLRFGQKFTFESHQFGSLSPSEIQSVWIRRPENPKIEKENISNSQIKFLENQWTETLRGFYACLQNSFWISNPEKMVIASRKAFQLNLARKKLLIPKTIITNRTDEAVSFAQECGGKVILKLPGRKWFLDSQNVRKVVPTSVVDIQGNNTLKVGNTPVILQEYIKDKTDIRVFVIGSVVLSAEIKVPPEIVDWRQGNTNNTEYAIHLLPKNIQAEVVSLTRKLDLNYAAVDFILDKNRNYYFLELNPLGEFLWIEEATGLAITRGLAKLLANP